MAKKKLINNSAVHEYLNNLDFEVSKLIYEELNKKVCIILLDAIERAKLNKRLTVMAIDL